MTIDLKIIKIDDIDKETLEKIYVESEFIDPIDEILKRIEDVSKEPISQPFQVLRNNDIVSFFTIESSNPNIDGKEEPEKGSYWLESFFITRTYLGKGLAKAVVNQLLQRINSFYPDASSLYLTVNFRNEIAKKLYKKCGFEDTGEIYSAGPAGPQHIYKKRVPDIQRQHRRRPLLPPKKN